MGETHRQSQKAVHVASPWLRRRRRRRSVGLLAIAITLTAILLFPLYWMFVTSILPIERLISSRPPIVPPLSDVSFSAYPQIFELKPMLRWFSNSAVVTLATVVLSVTVSTLAGYSLSRLRARGQQLLGYSLFSLKLLPGTLLVLPLYLLFQSLHLLNTLPSLIIANTAAIIPFATWMMKNFFDAVHVDIEHAALVDGCSRMQSFYRVVLPLSRPGLAATAVYAGILAWGDFLFARTLITNSEKWTMPIGVQSFVTEYTISWNELMAAGLSSVIPILILFAFLEPFLAGGLTKGAID